ncbi:MAG: hypothetical protein AAF502_20565 [Bacteroidota bacterium]
MKTLFHLCFFSIILIFAGCQTSANYTPDDSAVNTPETNEIPEDIQEKLDKYVSVRLTTDLSVLSENEKAMLPHLFEASRIMDDLFWYEAFGERDKFMEADVNDGLKKFLAINYGPWDRLDGNKSFWGGVSEKPLGANYYPEDMTKEEFEAADLADKEWSARLAKYAKFLPELQEGLPVDEKYKKEEPGRDTELNAYDVIYYAGDCNAGSKTIAINLPNDEQVQLEKGTRRLQLKNAMKAKFDKILVPIAGELIAEDQRQHITFDAFFSNTMFHEVAHGLGIKNTIDGSGTVRKALKEHASATEEGKADILGLHMITQIHEKGELDADLDRLSEAGIPVEVVFEQGPAILGM